MLRGSEVMAETFPEDEIHLLGISNQHPGITRIDERRLIRHYRVRILPLRGIKTLQFYLLFSFKIFFSYLFRPVRVIECHSVEFMGVATWLKFFKRDVRIVYNPHELETEKNGQTPRMRKVARLIENRYIRKYDHIIPVADKISEWYRKVYHISNVTTIFNMPDNPMLDYPTAPPGGFRDKFGIGPTDLIFIYQGKLMKRRNIDLMLEVFTRMPPDRHMLFMGFGEFVPKIKEYAAKYSNIHYQEAVPKEEILAHTAQADAGLLIGENACLSYYYSLPNKYFEYVLASVPVVTVDFPELHDYTLQLGCGWLVPEDYTVESSRQILLSLTREEIQQKKKATAAARSQVGFHLVAPKLKAVYLGISGS